MRPPAKWENVRNLYSGLYIYAPIAQAEKLRETAALNTQGGSGGGAVKHAPIGHSQGQDEQQEVRRGVKNVD